MVFADIVAFIKALPKMIDMLRELIDSVKDLRYSAIDKELETIKRDVAETIHKIEGAKTNEERKKLALELANRMSR